MLANFELKLVYLFCSSGIQHCLVQGTTHTLPLTVCAT